MNPIVRNILAVVAGLLGGSIVNMGLVKIGHQLMPIAGIDPSDMAALAEAMPDFSPKHFIFPFLAHAVGTLVGAALAAWLASDHKMKFAFAIGAFFLLGGIMVNYMLPGPTWFIVLDIGLAYIPMAWIGGKIGMKYSAKP